MRAGYRQIRAAHHRYREHLCTTFSAALDHPVAATCCQRLPRADVRYGHCLQCHFRNHHMRLVVSHAHAERDAAEMQCSDWRPQPQAAAEYTRRSARPALNNRREQLSAINHSGILRLTRYLNLIAQLGRPRRTTRCIFTKPAGFRGVLEPNHASKMYGHHVVVMVNLIQSCPLRQLGNREASS
jgi:hypothetical protein